MKSGVYVITCTANGNRYVGSSKNMKVRKSGHWISLRTRTHHNTHMQNVWNKYGESSFVFEVLEEVEVHLLLEREQYWIDTLKPELNKAIKAESGFLGLKHKQETKDRLRDKQINRLKSPELIERLRQAAKNQNARQPNGMKGRRLSEQEKQNLRDATKKQFSTKEGREKHSNAMKKWMTDEMRERIRKSKIGTKATENTKEKMKVAARNVWQFLGKKEREKRIKATAEKVVAAKAKTYKGFVSPDGTVCSNVYNLSEFCRQHNLLVSKMVLVDRGLRSHHKGWTKL